MKIYIPIFNTKIFDLQSLGYYQGYSLFSQTTLVYSLVLNYHPKIKALIKEKQDLLDGFPYPYPEQRDFKILYHIQKDLDDKITTFVDKASQEILNKLGWGKGWKDVIMAKIYTDMVPVPSEVFPFTFVDANPNAFRSKEETQEEIKSLRDLAKSSALSMAMALVPRFENANFPFIAIKERLTSKKPLIDYINRNFDSIIKPATEILPTRKHKKADVERFMISLWMFELLHSQNKKPKEVEKMIEEKDPEQTMYAKYDMTPTGISKLADEARVKLGQIYPL